jgi:23S rRNA (cytidine1920-2'-O)/16S rRNA (cytidine1409-2'-O)-methyltransferase
LGTLLSPGSGIVALIKPQFEAGREKVGKSGVVRDSAVHKEVLSEVLGFAAQSGYSLQHLTFSPIQGGEGNIEFLAHWLWEPGSSHSVPSEEQIVSVIREAGAAFTR